MLRLIESSVAADRAAARTGGPSPGARLLTASTTSPATPRTTGSSFDEMQRLRGSIYLDEGNVKRHELTTDGRHQTAEDDKSWHLLMTDERGPRPFVRALSPDMRIASSVQDLRLRNCPLVKRAESRYKVKVAVESEMARARRAGLRFAELGGWAISKERRGSPEGPHDGAGHLRPVADARRRASASRPPTSRTPAPRSFGDLAAPIWSSRAQPIPSYFDPKYNTEIDLLRFDSRYPSPKYAELIEIVMGKLANVSVVGGSRRRDARPLQRRQRPGATGVRCMTALRALVPRQLRQPHPATRSITRRRSTATSAG